MAQEQRHLSSAVSEEDTPVNVADCSCMCSTRDTWVALRKQAAEAAEEAPAGNRLVPGADFSRTCDASAAAQTNLGAVRRLLCHPPREPDPAAAAHVPITARPFPLTLTLFIADAEAAVSEPPQLAKPVALSLALWA